MSWSRAVFAVSSAAGVESRVLEQLKHLCLHSQHLGTAEDGSAFTGGCVQQPFQPKAGSGIQRRCGKSGNPACCLTSHPLGNQWADVL